MLKDQQQIIINQLSTCCLITFYYFRRDSYAVTLLCGYKNTHIN